MVKRVLLGACMVSALALSTGAYAQTAYIGTKSYSAGTSIFGDGQGRVFSFELSDPSTPTGSFCVMPTNEASMEDYAIKAGCSMGDYYYAFVEGDGGSASFRAFNFEASEVLTISESGPGFVPSDMTYDATSGNLFALRMAGASSMIYTVNPNTGAAERYDSIAGVSLCAMAADGNGTIYAVSSRQTGELGQNVQNLTLYSYNVESKQLTELRAVGSVSGALLANTMEYYDGNLYFVGGRRSISRINPAEGELTVLGDMPHTTLAGLTFTKATATPTITPGEDEPVVTPPVVEDNGMRVKYEETWGDHMGTAGPTEVTRRNVTWYDEYNRPVRAASYGGLYSSTGAGMSGQFQITGYTKYDYNEAGQMVASHSEQYGQYSGEDFAFKAKNDTITYEYDSNGRLVRENDVYSGYYTIYEYDEIGQTTYMARMAPDYYNQYGSDYYVMNSETYSDFVAYNEPRTILGNGAYDSYCFVIDNEFDEANHKVKATKWNADRTVKQTVEYWTWRNDSIVEYISYRARSNGEGGWNETPSSRRTYECVDGDPNKVKMQGYSYNSATGEWGANPYSNVTIQGYYGELFAPTNLQAHQIADAVNSYTFTFQAPNVPVFGDVAYDIYRHGMLVGQVKQSDNTAYDAETGRVTFRDYNVPNGDYDYMVQTVVYDEMSGDSTVYNVSNCVELHPYVELPAATNLHYVSYDNSTGEDLVTVAWDAPAYTDDLMFQRYNVFITQLGMRAAENNDEDGQDTQYTLTFRFDEEDVFVQTVYHFGKVNSDTIHINVLTLTPTGIDGVAQDAEGRVSVSTSEIAIADGMASEIVVFGINGAKEASFSNVSRADISGLSRGVYVAFINAGGKQYAIKFAK